MASLTFKVNADTTPLGKGLLRARSMVKKFSTTVKKMGLLGLKLGAIGAAGGLAGLAVAARGVKGALDFGGQLSDLSARTGILAGDLVVLQRAFKDNGIAGEKLGPIINKMQKGITDFGAGLSTQVRAFERLGISYGEIEGKSPVEQFEMIQQALVGIEDPTKRAATAMDIFGRSGGELQALFNDAGALGKARQSVGGMADILNKNAQDFDRASDLLNGMGDKLQGFFVGMASYITPVLLPVLEQINKVDLAGWGEAAGKFVSTLATAFSEGKLGSMAKDALVIAAKAMISTLWAGIRAVIKFQTVGLVEGVKMAWSKVTDMSFWQGVIALIKSAGTYLQAIGYELAGVLYGEDQARAAASLKSLSKKEASMALEKMGEAGDGRNPLDVLKEALAAAGEEYAKSIADPLMDGTAEQARLRQTFEEMQRLMEERKRQEEANNDPAKGKDAGITDGLAKAVTGAIKPQVTALQRVGGATLGGVGVGMDQERNRLLKSIDRKVGQPSGAVWA